MKLSLFILESDRQKFMNGSAIKAIADNRVNTALSGRSNENPLINVIIEDGEIIGTQIHEERGMVRGNFLYYMIQRKV